MKKIALFIFGGMLSLNIANAQISFQGIKTSSRAGVMSTLLNPAELAQMPQKFDFHLFGLDVNINNSLVPLTISNIENFNDPAKLFFEKYSSPNPFNARIGVDVMGPSIAYAINQNTTFAVSTRGRFAMNLNDIDINLGKTLAGTSVEDLINVPISTNQQSMTIMGWTELGLSAATTLMNTPKYLVKIGGTGKVLFPGLYANAYVRANGLTANIDTTGGTVRSYISGNANLGLAYSSGNLNEIANNLIGSPSGFCADAGISYHLKDQKDPSKHLLKVGVSLMDIGYVKFDVDNNNSKEYTLTGDPSQELSSLISDNLETTQRNLENAGMLTETSRSESIEAKLPMAMNLYADARIWKPFYLTFVWQQAVNDKMNPRNLLAQNYWGLTPRFVTRFIEIYTPFTYTETAGRFVGAGMKVGPLYFGSSSVLSAVFGDSSKQIDFHFGIRMGFGKTVKPAVAK